MVKRVDTKEPRSIEMARQVKRLGTANPAGHTSVTEGTFRVASDEGLIVEGSERITGLWFLDGVGEVTGSISIFGGPGGAGSLYANGTVDFEGEFTADGMNTLSGTNLLSGPTKVTGTFEIEGATTITGETDITGAVDISGEFKSTGNVFLNGTTRLNGDSFVTGALSITGATKVMSSFEASGDTKLGGTLTISGATTVTNTFRAIGGITTEGSLRAEGPTTLAGTTRLESTLTVVGSIVSGGVTIDNNRVRVSAGGHTSEMGATGMSASSAQFSALRLPGLAEPGSVPDGGKWLMAAGESNVVIAIGQDIGGPMGSLEWPFDPSTITDGFGPRDSPGGVGSTDHKGVDVSFAEGTPVVTAGAGTVVFAGGSASVGWGFYVKVDHGGGIETLYAHLSSVLVSVGQSVGRRKVLGLSGNTGTSTGPHLHFEVWQNGTQIDPEGYITKPWTG